jgi:hypothetical protein
MNGREIIKKLEQAGWMLSRIEGSHQWSSGDRISNSPKLPVPPFGFTLICLFGMVYKEVGYGYDYI